jgi:hypothetical protein
MGEFEVSEMTKFESLKLLLGRVTYKPGWEFKLICPENQWEPIQLLITQKARDVNNLSAQIMLSTITAITWDIATQMSEQDFIYFVGTAIRDFELHEMDEWFKLGGKCVFEAKHYVHG